MGAADFSHHSIGPFFKMVKNKMAHLSVVVQVQLYNSSRTGPCIDQAQAQLEWYVGRINV